MTWFARTTAIALEPARLETAELYHGLSSQCELSLRAVPLPNDSICEVTGAVLKIKALAEVIRGVLAPSRLVRRERVALVVPAVACFFRTVAVPKEHADDPAGWFCVHAREYLPCEPSLLSYDVSCGVHRSFGIPTLLVVAMKRTLLSSYIDVATELGHEISMVLPSWVARWNWLCATGIAIPSRIATTVYLYRNTFEVCVWSRDVLLGALSAPMPTGGQQEILSWLGTHEGLRRCMRGIGEDILKEFWASSNPLSASMHPETIIVRDQTVDPGPAQHSRLLLNSARVPRLLNEFNQRTEAYDAVLGAMLTTGELSAHRVGEEL